MLVVSLFEANPVRGLAFHPTQPLLAASLHNGSVQLWNYRMGVLVDRFEEHEGACLSVGFFVDCSQRRQGLCAACTFIRAALCWLQAVMTTKSKSGVRCSKVVPCPHPDILQISGRRTVVAYSRYMAIWTMSEPCSSTMKCPGL